MRRHVSARAGIPALLRAPAGACRKVLSALKDLSESEETSPSPLSPLAPHELRKPLAEAQPVPRLDFTLEAAAPAPSPCLIQISSASGEEERG